MEAILQPDLQGKQVLLGVSGGIAAYKAAELCRSLIRCGAEVRVMMTRAATRFVGELTFAALSGHPVATDLFDPAREAQIGHIDLADSADLMLLAPATANRMAKMAHGVADDLLSTVYLAFTGPVLLAPAMNVNMWQHPATQENLRIMRLRKHSIVGPEAGELACGHQGPGRMSEPDQILQAAGACLSPGDLQGRRILITAGPTHEPVDPVRFLGNRSSGKMGFALAAEAAARGARVTLLAGPCSLPTPYQVARIDVRDAAEMADFVTSKVGDQDVLIMAAAVADFRPASAQQTKIKKEAAGETLELKLERTKDILSGVGAMDRHPYLVGFAAETVDDLEGIVREKLAAKGCDMLVANDVRAADAGFEADTNRVLILEAGKEAAAVPLCSKRQVAAEILERVAGRLR